ILSLKLEAESFKTTRMSENFYSAKILNSDSILVAKQQRSWSKGLFLLIADCYHAEISELKATAQTNKGIILKLSYPLKYVYTQELYLGEAIFEAFFVEKHKGLLSLYYQTLSKERL